MIILAALAICTLTAAGDEWQGKCGPIDGETPVITLTRTAAIPSGSWRKDAKPEEVFAGVSDLPRDLNQPVELEIYRGNSGVLRSVQVGAGLELSGE